MAPYIKPSSRRFRAVELSAEAKCFAHAEVAADWTPQLLCRLHGGHSLLHVCPRRANPGEHRDKFLQHLHRAFTPASITIPA